MDDALKHIRRKRRSRYKLNVKTAKEPDTIFDTKPKNQPKRKRRLSSTVKEFIKQKRRKLDLKVAKYVPPDTLPTPVSNITPPQKKTLDLWKNLGKPAEKKVETENKSLILWKRLLEQKKKKEVKEIEEVKEVDGKLEELRSMTYIDNARRLPKVLNYPDAPKINPRQTLLIYGQPGCGKRYFVEHYYRNYEIVTLSVDDFVVYKESTEFFTKHKYEFKPPTRIPSKIRGKDVLCFFPHANEFMEMAHKEKFIKYMTSTVRQRYILDVPMIITCQEADKYSVEQFWKPIYKIGKTDTIRIYNRSKYDVLKVLNLVRRTLRLRGNSKVESTNINNVLSNKQFQDRLHGSEYKMEEPSMKTDASNAGMFDIFNKRNQSNAREHLHASSRSTVDKFISVLLDTIVYQQYWNSHEAAFAESAEFFNYYEMFINVVHDKEMLMEGNASLFHGCGDSFYYLMIESMCKISLNLKYVSVKYSLLPKIDFVNFSYVSTLHFYNQENMNPEERIVFLHTLINRSRRDYSFVQLTNKLNIKQINRLVL